MVRVGYAMLTGPAAPDRLGPDDPLVPTMVGDVRPGMVWFTLARYPRMVRVDGCTFRWATHLRIASHILPHNVMLLVIASVAPA